MKGCFAFNKKIYEDIVKKSEVDADGAFIDLIEYIKYGLYEEVRADMSLEDQLRYQRIFKNRDITFAKKTDGLFGGEFKWLNGGRVGNADNAAYNKLKEEYDILEKEYKVSEVFAKKRDEAYNEIAENLRKAIKILRPTAQQREQLENAGLGLYDLGVLIEDD